MPNFTEKIFKAGTWTAASNITALAVTTLTTIYIANNVSPGEFGAVGFCLLIIGIISFVSEPGIVSGLIRLKRVSARYAETAASISLLFGIIVYLCIYSLAPIIEKASGYENVTSITRIAALTILIRSFCFVPAAMQSRTIVYKNLALFKCLSSIIGSSIAIIIVKIGGSYWAIAARELAMAATTTICYVLFLNWRTKFSFSKRYALNILRFGKQVVASNVINFANENADKLIISITFGPKELGLYNLALQISRAPLNRLKIIIGGLLFPIFSSTSSNSKLSSELWFFLTIAVPLAISPLLLFIASNSNTIVELLLNEHWSQINILIKLLCVNVFFLASSVPDNAFASCMGQLKSLNASQARILLGTVLLASLLGLHFGFFTFCAAFTAGYSGQVIANKVVIFKRSKHKPKVKIYFITAASLILGFSLANVFTHFIFTDNLVCSIASLVVSLVCLAVSIYFIHIAYKRYLSTSLKSHNHHD